jgi:hypothetical protein
MKYRRPGKIRPFKRLPARSLVAVVILALGVAGDVITHDYAFIVGGAIGVLTAVIPAVLQRRRRQQTASTPDIGWSRAQAAQTAKQGASQNATLT